MTNLFWLTDVQMARLQPFFPKSHGKPRVDDRRVLSGIIFINRNGLRWRDAPREYGGGSQPGTQLSPVLYRAARGRRELLRIIVGQQNSGESPRLTASSKPRSGCLDGHHPSRAFFAFLSGVPKCRHVSSH